MSDADVALLSKVLNIFLVVTSVGSLYFRFKTPKGNITAKDLIKILDEKEKEIDRLHSEIKVWKHHHKRLANDSTPKPNS